eukprot:TRINITY_DN703_c1_g1_i2.p1 TRINITY_DN703_c1_g1~~TRINITY_DN703_c1_g1_i2.p1  ORF type:complete len:1017 (-),score=227.10 TRINITY_DN703_c1_g1_i2:65-3115(-)
MSSCYDLQEEEEEEEEEVEPEKGTPRVQCAKPSPDLNPYGLVEESDEEEEEEEEEQEEVTTSHVTQTKVERCHWNLKFQAALEPVKRDIDKSDLPYQQRQQIWQDLADIAMDFTYAAKTYGRIIISEVYQTNEKRTLQPVSIGGLAGGEKFIIESILFKFAIDTEGIFGGDELASYKNAGQELLCLNAYSNLTLYPTTDKPTPDFSFPLCALIDYRGFRLISMALLPIEGGSSLIYGSADGADTVLNTDPEASKIMLQTADILGLKEHYVCEHSRTNAVKLAAAADIELHKGLDNRYYLLDYSRGMPPQDTDLQKKVPMRHMLLKLRPEWLNIHGTPLNPDVFSYFIRFEAPRDKDNMSPEEIELRKAVRAQCRADERDVKEATKKLILEQIPFVAKRLPQLTLGLSGLESRMLLQDWMSVLIHFYGINLRFMGLIRNEMEKEKERLIESGLTPKEAAPVEKSEAERTKDELRCQFNMEFKDPNLKLSAFITSLFEQMDRDNDGTVTWEEFTTFLLELQGKHKVDTNLISHFDSWSNHLLIQMIARVLKHEFNRKLREHMRFLKHTGERPYIAVVVAYLNLIFGESPSSVEYWDKPLRKLLKKQFLDCLKSVPADVSLKEMLQGMKLDLVDENEGIVEVDGICVLFDRLCTLCGFDWRGTTRQQFSTRPDLYKVSSPFDNNDMISLDECIKKTQIIAHSQGVVLRMKAVATASRPKYSRNLSRQSIAEFKQSLSAVPRNQRTLRNTADVLSDMNLSGLADLFYRMAEECAPRDAVTLYKYGYFLANQNRYEEAEKYYKKSIDIKPRGGSLISFAKFLVSQQRNAEAGEAFKRAKDLFPKNANAHRNYAQFLSVVMGETGEEVERALKRALELDPKSPGIYNDLAEYYSKVNNKEQEVHFHEQYSLLKTKDSGRLYVSSRAEPIAFRRLKIGVRSDETCGTDRSDKVDPEPERLETEKVETEKVEPEKVETKNVETEKVETVKVETEAVETEKAEKIEIEKVETEKEVNNATNAVSS